MIQTLGKKITANWVGRIANRAISVFELSILSYFHDKETVLLLKRIIREESLLTLTLRPNEFFIIYSFAKAQRSIEGDYAEVGVWKGSTAKIICEGKEDKVLHLFDTFESFPHSIGDIDWRFKRQDFTTDVNKVKERLSPYKNVHIYRGMFPETAGPVEKKMFAFVHLDADIYQSTKACLEFFYTRMSRGGIILTHDYHTEGVRKAFDEFFENKPESVIRLPTSQCMVIKR